jgi:CheY-like chemotaxis protein
LIIDDQPSSARIVEQVLTANGKYRIYTAHSGEEGISLVARRHPDLIILDLRMPGMDGFAVLNELRSNPETARIPIMIVTADQIGREDQERLGNIHVIYKTDLSQENYQAFLEGIHQYLVR